MRHEAAWEQGMRERFVAIYEENEARLSTYALRRTTSEEDAADLVAETFAVAWRRIAHVPGGEAATLWLFGVARRLLANQRRGELRRRRLATRLAGQREPPAAHEQEHALDRDAFQRALGRMPEEQREVLSLVAWEGLTTSELASVLGCTGNAAKIRLHRARKRLAKELAQEAELDLEKPARPRGQESLQMRAAITTEGDSR
ncbi:MAG: RNA polymerase sigma factor [Solirubrobacteraceae bacterium]